MEEKSFYSWAKGRFHLNFLNGNTISCVFAGGTYSDEYDNDFRDAPFYNSNTIEIMFSCPDKLKKKILKKYNESDEDPIGYLTIDKWLEIVNLLAK